MSLARHNGLRRRPAPPPSVRVLGWVVALAVAGLAWSSASAPATGTVRCDRVAAPNGSNRARGTPHAPFRTVQRLARALRPGQTGCLRGGIYREDVTIRRGGTAVDPTVLRSFPGTRATLVGRLVLARSAAYTVISNLRLVGLERGHACAKMCPSPTVNADHTTFVNDEVTNHHADATCFLLGDANGVFGRADYTTISDSRIHDCGALPPTDLDHGIYVEASSGTRIFRNLIYGNADRGIQLYPDADHTRIAGNVIDGNGQGVDFGARGAQTTDDNLVEYNVVSNARVSYNVLSAYGPGDKVGDGNIVANNCIGGGRASAWGPGGISRNHLGFWLRGNLLTVPRFRNARHGNFQLVKGRRCQRLLAAGDG